MKLILLSLFPFLIFSNEELIMPKGNSIRTRFKTPDGFKRISYEQNSFEEYLRNLPLKPNGTRVLYYNGETKENDSVYDAVVDLPIGKKDLHQCADAVIRLRAEYFYKNQLYDKISFQFTNGFEANYSNWMNGERISVKGNKVSWIKKNKPSNEYSDFWKYLEIVFSYAGTISLSKELHKQNLEDLKIGDVFIWSGSPGHAVIVVDLAFDKRSQEKIFLLAQSYMPAQEIQILQNPMDKKLSPWYSVDFGKELKTPEWKFRKTDLKKFEKE